MIIKNIIKLNLETLINCLVMINDKKFLMSEEANFMTVYNTTAYGKDL